MMLLLSLALLIRIASVSSYIYNTDYYYAQYNPGSCLPGLSSSDLRQISVDMANQSSANIFNHLLPNILKVRVPGTQGNLEVRQFIKNEMSSLGWYVEEDSFVSPTPAGEISFSNVIATLNPSVARRIVMACHYDSKLIPGSRPFVAATDSGVPCALLMDAAKQLPTVMSGRSAGSQNDFTFQFIFFDGEEAFAEWTSTDSLYGSRHLAGLWQNTPDRNDPRAANKLQNIELFMLLDLIGAPDSRFVNFYRETWHHFYRLSHLENCLINSNLRARPYGRRMFDVYGRWNTVEDDHVPFMQRGVPILHLISVPFPRVWHTADDNIHSLDRGLVADFAAILRLFMTALLQGV